ncbi:ABC transporter ATP-binding protein [Paractinoplanes rishiriensis]|uniref:Multidrug ABC transporter ATP-binding protein n=1 Tax=Paractinoplanes rishiriensis TaxID=1050105 RepID=A0A919N1M7_9ACTN|nr:ABC transporter ATP-binding protein [Actinoplanes rishiriensis]GIE97327.1 multidrug ABC transporter ATP-binding protein [Actinoplanes rishiriensis]
MPGDLAIDVDDLRMRYGSTDVLHGVSFRAEPGEVLALLGPNGAGKTTTVEILEGFRLRSAGRVAVLGADPATAGEDWRARVGVVLQSWRDHGKWRVRELLAQMAAYYPGPWDPDALMAAVGLTDRKVRTLSGGQRRRLDVAIGIVGRPDVLFLDEPTTGFDPEARRDFHDLVRGLAAEHGTTILLTTHDLDEAERLAGRILVLDGGRIVGDGTAAELSRRIAGRDEVRWSLRGERFARPTEEPARLVHDLYRDHGDALRDLEVRRASLEDTYLALVHKAEGRAA